MRNLSITDRIHKLGGLRTFVKVLTLAVNVLTVWVTVQTVRYLAYEVVYSRTETTFVTRWLHSMNDLVAEIPAVAIGLALSYLLVFRLARTALGFGRGYYATRELERAVFVSSLVLLSTSIAGFIVWILLLGSLAVDWLIVVIAAAMMVVASYVVFWRGKRLSSTVG